MTKDSNHDGCRGRRYSIRRNVPIGKRNNCERSQANPFDNRFDERHRRATTGRPPDEVHDGSDNQTHTPTRHDIDGELSAHEQSREPDQHHHIALTRRLKRPTKGMAAMASAATTAAWVDGNTVVFTGLPRRMI